MESTHLQSRVHLALFLSVRRIVEVLHRDERRELVVDRVVCVSGITTLQKQAALTLHGVELIVSISLPLRLGRTW